MYLGYDWDEFRTGYNRMYNTKYNTVKQMILCELKDISTDEFCFRLGISNKTLLTKRIKLRISSVDLSGPPKIEQIKELHNLGKIKKMTSLEIMKKVGISSGYFFKLANLLGIDYKHVHAHSSRKNLSGKFEIIRHEI